MSVTLPDGTVITDDTSPTTGLKAGGHRTRFYPCLSAIATWAGQVQAWAAQAQAAAGAGGGTIFPSVNVNNAGQSLVLNSAGTAYLADSAAKGFRNKIINGSLDIAQRGTTFSTTGYTLDQWTCDPSYACNVSQQAFTPVNPITGQEPSYFMRINGASLSLIKQRIENVRTIAGITCTLSFWAKLGSAASITAYFSQNFGSGGSATVNNINVYSPSVTTAWTRYSTTFTMPSISGKTVGTGSFLELVIYSGAGTTLDLYGLQIEEGSVATPFERRPYGLELSLCQRYYQTYNAFISQSSTSKTTFPINMRTTPTIGGGGAGFTSTGTTADALHCYQTTGAAQTLTLSAEL